MRRRLSSALRLKARGSDEFVPDLSGKEKRLLFHHLTTAGHCIGRSRIQTAGAILFVVAS